MAPSARRVTKKQLATTLLEPIGEILAYGTVRIYIAEVTPTIAARFIDDETGINEQNRGLIGTNLARIGSAMKAGHWRFTHQGIAFDTEGFLIDGQHRMRGVVDSGKSQRFLIVEGLPPATRMFIDQGANRTLADAFAIGGDSPRPSLAAMVVSAIERTGKNNNIKIDYETGKALIAKHRDGLEWAYKAVPRQRKAANFSSGAIVGAFVLAYPKSPKIVPTAYRELCSGANLAEHDPILKLRAAIYDEDRNALRGETCRREFFQKTLNAIYLRAHGGTVKQLKISEEATRHYLESAK